jgi:putrescine transport system permease protein
MSTARPHPAPLPQMRRALGALGRGRNWVIGLPFACLLALFLMPFLIIIKISVSEMDESGLKSLWVYGEQGLALHIRWSHYGFLAQDALYAHAFMASLKYASITTVICLLLGYPFAYFLARARRQGLLLWLVMVPFWTSFLLRVYAWKGLLAEHGWVAQALGTMGLDQLLLSLGAIQRPGVLLHTPFSLVLGMVYTYVPFVVLALYANLARLDTRLLEAAADLGATPWVVFWRVTVPLSKPGIVAAAMLVFIPSVGEYVVPELLGGPQTLMIGRVIWDEFFSNNDWPMACALAVVVVLMMLLPLSVFTSQQAKVREASP